MADVCGLHKPEHGMPERPFLSARNRPSHGPHHRMQTPELFGCLLELPPDTPHRGIPAHNYIHHTFQMLLLCKDVTQIKERGSHLPTVYAVLF
jgi:hypothetical protein